MNENDNKLKIKGLSPYSVIPESANIRPKTGMAYNLPEISVTPQNNPQTAPLTAADVKNKQTLISNINKAQNTAGQVGYNVIDTAMGFTNPLWGLASGVAHGGLALKDIKDNGLTWSNALNAGLGIGMLGKSLPSSQTIFNNLPYKFLENFPKNVGNFLRTPVNKNPFKNIKTYQDKRYFASSRPLNITSDNSYTTTTKNPIDLLKQRAKLRDFGYFTLGEDLSEGERIIKDTPIYTYLSPRFIYNDLRKGYGIIKSIIKTPSYYLKGNMEPGFYSSESFVKINPKALKDWGLSNKDQVISHELAHALWRNSLIRPESPAGFRFNFLPKGVQRYFDADELAARGTQLKNYFGISDNSPITADMLKYAAKNYVKDTGINNNMNQFFRGIIDWDKAADWISKASFKEGGKIIEKFKNRNKQINLK